MKINILQGNTLPEKYLVNLNPETGTYLVSWGFTQIEDYVSDVGEIEVRVNRYQYCTQEFKYKPTLEEIKTIVIDYCNKQCDKKIVEEFKFNGVPVWLNTEDQINYKAKWDIYHKTNREFKPIKIKAGDNLTPVYINFTTLEEYDNFIFEMLDYISETQSQCWEEKDSIDWNKYIID